MPIKGDTTQSNSNKLNEKIHGRQASSKGNKIFITKTDVTNVKIKVVEH